MSNALRATRRGTLRTSAGRRAHSWTEEKQVQVEHKLRSKDWSIQCDRRYLRLCIGLKLSTISSCSVLASRFMVHCTHNWNLESQSEIKLMTAHPSELLLSMWSILMLWGHWHKNWIVPTVKQGPLFLRKLTFQVNEDQSINPGKRRNSRIVSRQCSPSLEQVHDIPRSYLWFSSCMYGQERWISEIHSLVLLYFGTVLKQAPCPSSRLLISWGCFTIIPAWGVSLVNILALSISICSLFNLTAVESFLTLLYIIRGHLNR